MRKKLQLLFILLISIFYKSQDNSIAASVNTPTSYQTGVPDISYPIGSLPAAKDFTINFRLVYNPNSYEGGDYSGKIARNWMLLGSNFMITQDQNGMLYYNVNGESGSFYYKRSGVFPNFIYELITTTSTTVKIECIRKQTLYSWQPQHIESFTITDTKGYKYVFEDFDFRIYSDPFTGNANVESRDAYYVTKINDASNKTIAIFTNKKQVSSILNSVHIPETITTNYGKMSFETIDSGSGWNLHDRYSFKSFTLKDHKDKFISKYELQIEELSYSYYDIEKFGTIEPQLIKVRMLRSLKKIDSNSNIIENTNFGYKSIPALPPTWGSNLNAGVYKKGELLLNGILGHIIASSGSKVEYYFERNTLKIDPPIDYNTPGYINDIQSLNTVEKPPFSFITKTDSISFDSKITKKYYLTNIQRSPSSRIYIKFNKEVIYPFDPGGPTIPTLGPTPEPKLAYKIGGANGISYNEIDIKYSAARVLPSDGSAYLEITGTGGTGWFEIYEKFWSEPPYIKKNEDYSDGVRIKEIKYYSRAENFNTYYPAFNLIKSTMFDYDVFEEEGASSGTLADTEVLVYKNVKVTESDKSGYIKYYYKTPTDFPSYPLSSDPTVLFSPFNYTKRGVLHKKEVFNSNNIINKSSIYDYIFPSTATSIDLGNNVIPEKAMTTETIYDSSGNFLTDTSERTFNQENNNLLSEKHTFADGTVSETIYQYAAEKGNSKLLGAGMFSVPLEVIQKQNGIQTGKLETKYDQVGNYFPSSIISFGINNVITGEQSNEIYDSMGNVLQTRSKSGIPTAIIWGYDGTQPIAKIEGGEYFTVLSLMGESNVNLLDVVQKSNQDVESSDNTNEQLLRNALEAFRKKPEFKNYLITTFTYDPLIGVKSVTSPNGMTEYYYYDNQNRLIRIEDTNHNVITESKYLQNIYSN